MKGMNIKDLEKEGYKEIETIDLVNNKKEAMLVNLLLNARRVALRSLGQFPDPWVVCYK